MFLDRFRSCRVIFFTALAAMSLGLLAACGPAAQPLTTSVNTPAAVSHSDSEPVQDLDSLVTALQAKGLTITPAGSVTQPFISVKGTRCQIGAEDLQVYVYPDAKGPAFDAEQIQPDGSVAGMNIAWIAQPHFYKRGLLLVIYLGQDPQVLAALEAILGAPFASGPAR